MAQRWTRDGIIRHLLEREAKGLPLTLRGEGVELLFYEAARRVFGSWPNALKAAGISPGRILTRGQWSPAKIVATIQRLARRNRSLTTDQLEKRYHNLVTSARRHFGTWSKAVLAAGADPAKFQRVLWTRESIIEAILTRALRNESLVGRRVEPQSLPEAAVRHFGNWSSAILAAGLDPALALARSRGGRPVKRAPKTFPRERRPGVPRRWTREEIASQLQARLQEQKPIHASALRAECPTLDRELHRQFGGWHLAMLALGFDADVHRHHLGRRPRTPLTPLRGVNDLKAQAPEQMRPRKPD